jgi:hypothetical protein
MQFGYKRYDSTCRGIENSKQPAVNSKQRAVWTDMHTAALAEIMRDMLSHPKPYPTESPNDHDQTQRSRYI